MGERINCWWLARSWKEEEKVYSQVYAESIYSLNVLKGDLIWFSFHLWKNCDGNPLNNKIKRFKRGRVILIT